MNRRTVLAATGISLSTPLAGCLGDTSVLGGTGEGERGERTPDECPDPDLEAPMTYEAFDYDPAGAPDRDREEVVLLTTQEDVARYEEQTNVPEGVDGAEFGTQFGVVVERVLTGNWGSHHLLGLERADAETVAVHVCSTGKPEPPKNDVVGRLTFGLLVDYDGEAPTDGYVHHHQVSDD